MSGFCENCNAQVLDADSLKKHMSSFHPVDRSRGFFALSNYPLPPAVLDMSRKLVKLQHLERVCQGCVYNHCSQMQHSFFGGCKEFGQDTLGWLSFSTAVDKAIQVLGYDDMLPDFLVEEVTAAWRSEAERELKREIIHPEPETDEILHVEEVDEANLDFIGKCLEMFHTEHHNHINIPPIGHNDVVIHFKEALSWAGLRNLDASGRDKYLRRTFSRLFGDEFPEHWMHKLDPIKFDVNCPY